MEHYSGLDVSLETTFISIIDQNGEIIKEDIVATDVELIAKYLLEQNIEHKRIGVESGQLSISLCKGLISKGLPIICVDARHMAAALSARINKNDKNDARGIAKMMRVGLYKEVQVKTDQSCQLKILLGSRRQLINSRQQLMGTIRGLLKIHGIKIGKRMILPNFVKKVSERILELDKIERISIGSLLSSLEAIWLSLSELDASLAMLGKENKDCVLLMTIPGVGIITAMTYRATLDEPARFVESEAVGAYMGLTPRQYASGEIDRHGSISKMGPKECRSALYEAAQSLLLVSKRESKIKSWGLRIAKKKGVKKAIVAVARKLAVVMHRMLISRKEFCYQ